MSPPRPEERGSALVLLTVLMTSLFIFAALALDVGNVLREQRKAHIGTDAAALAALVPLTNQVQTIASVSAAALDVAVANGVTAAEIAAGAAGNIEIGIWSNAQFYANEQAGGRYNAVRVPARRTVDLHFARVIGWSRMQPRVDSVARLDTLSAATGLRPWGVSSNLLAGVGIGGTVTVDLKAEQEGIWGYAYFNQDVEDWNTTDWRDYMATGYPRAVQIANPHALYAKRGNPQLANAIEELAASGEVVYIPVASNWDSTELGKFVPLVGFIAVRLTKAPKQGNKQNIVFTLVRAIGNGTGGGPTGPVWLLGRDLVR